MKKLLTLSLILSLIGGMAMADKSPVPTRGNGTVLTPCVDCPENDKRDAAREKVPFGAPLPFDVIPPFELRGHGHAQ